MNYERIKSSPKLKSSSVPTTPIIQSQNSFQLLENNRTATGRTKKKKKAQHRSKKSNASARSQSPPTTWDEITPSRNIDQVVPTTSTSATLLGTTLPACSSPLIRSHTVESLMSTTSTTSTQDKSIDYSSTSSSPTLIHTQLENNNNNDNNNHHDNNDNNSILSPTPLSPYSLKVDTTQFNTNNNSNDDDKNNNNPTASTNNNENKNNNHQQHHSTRPSMSFWDYLMDELTVSDFDTSQEIKRERITNFLAVPGALEKMMGFGFVVCLDSFLYTFTILPLRFGLALYHLFLYIYTSLQVWWKKEGSYTRLRPSEKCDLLKGIIIIITCIFMSNLDPSRLYHSIRGQAVLKLYVIFNALEIFDKLCCSVGVDILDALFSKSTLGRPPAGDINAANYAKRHLKPITLFLLACVYMFLHTSTLFFQMITLNVAINFYSNALLSLLISNQFVEIKQSVFKKFERENLFQLSCSDIVERFQQSAFLIIITLRNVVELSESSPSSILPSTFVPLFKLPASTSLNTLMTPVVMVILSEVCVDWLKHAFITKFNQIRPSIYGKYIDILCRDLVIGSPGRLSGKKQAFIDQSPVVSRRIGFPSIPLACMTIRMMQQLLPMIFMSSSSSSHSFGNGNTDSPSSSSLATMITNILLNYINDHPNNMIERILPARIQLVAFSMIHDGWFEKSLDQLLKYMTWTFLVLVLIIILFALKVFVGMSLLGYAYKRYSSMEERDLLDQQKEKELKEMNKPEEEYQKRLKKYVNDPSDNVMGKPPIKYTLDNVDRFSMVRSRIP
ncbi:unnamed protein product [Cunninghamella blakesleeana]